MQGEDATKRALDIIVVGGSFAGIKSAWDLHNKIPKHHRITLISDKPRTVIRASFPRVVFEDVPLEELTLDLAKNFKGTGIEFIHDPVVGIDQEANQVITAEGKHKFDFLIVVTRALLTFGVSAIVGTIIGALRGISMNDEEIATMASEIL